MGIISDRLSARGTTFTGDMAPLEDAIISSPQMEQLQKKYDSGAEMVAEESKKMPLSEFLGKLGIAIEEKKKSRTEGYALAIYPDGRKAIRLPKGESVDDPKISRAIWHELGHHFDRANIHGGRGQFSSRFQYGTHSTPNYKVLQANKDYILKQRIAPELKITYTINKKKYHGLDEVLADPDVSEKNKNWARMQDSKNKFTIQMYLEQDIELFAEGFALFVESPAKMKAEAPELYELFAKAASEHPEIAEAGYNVAAKKKHPFEHVSDDSTRELKNKWGVSFGKDKDGYFCYTHRARSKSYPTIADIPKSALKFIDSTGMKTAAKKEITDEQREAILSHPRIDHIGTAKNRAWKIWRGESQSTGSNAAKYGHGLYTTTHRKEAEGYGAVRQMSFDDLPGKTLWFKTPGDWEIWWNDALYRTLGYKNLREFGKDYPRVDEFVRALDPSIEGVAIGDITGAMFVKYPEMSATAAQKSALHIFDFDGTLVDTGEFDQDRIENPKPIRKNLDKFKRLIDDDADVVVMTARSNAGLVRRTLEDLGVEMVGIRIIALGDPKATAKGEYIAKNLASKYDTITLYDDRQQYLNAVEEAMEDKDAALKTVKAIKDGFYPIEISEENIERYNALESADKSGEHGVGDIINMALGRYWDILKRELDSASPQIQASLRANGFAVLAYDTEVPPNPVTGEPGKTVYLHINNGGVSFWIGEHKFVDNETGETLIYQPTIEMRAGHFGNTTNMLSLMASPSILHDLAAYFEECAKLWDVAYIGDDQLMDGPMEARIEPVQASRRGKWIKIADLRDGESVYHAKTFIMANSDWKKIGDFGVDSGLFAITDPCYVIKNDGKRAVDDAVSDWDEFLDDHDHVKQPTNVPFAAGHDGLMFVTPAGGHDGNYEVWGRWDDDGNLVEIKIPLRTQAVLGVTIFPGGCNADRYDVEKTVRDESHMRTNHDFDVSEDIRIALIDAEQVRNEKSVDFCLGGSWLTYPFIPTCEIWLDRSLSPKDILATLIHEITEIGIMRWGFTYGEAHDMASRVEETLRDITKDTHLAVVPCATDTEEDPQIFVLTKRDELRHKITDFPKIKESNEPIDFVPQIESAARKVIAAMKERSIMPKQYQIVRTDGSVSYKELSVTAAKGMERKDGIASVVAVDSFEVRAFTSPADADRGKFAGAIDKAIERGMLFYLGWLGGGLAQDYFSKQTKKAEAEIDIYSALPEMLKRYGADTLSDAEKAEIRDELKRAGWDATDAGVDYLWTEWLPYRNA